MKRILMMIGLCLGLSACASNQEILVAPHHTAFAPPPNFTECDLQKLPGEFKDEKEIQTFLAETYAKNKECYINSQSLKRYIEAQKGIIK